MSRMWAPAGRSHDGPRRSGDHSGVWSVLLGDVVSHSAPPRALSTRCERSVPRSTGSPRGFRGVPPSAEGGPGPEGRAGRGFRSWVRSRWVRGTRSRGRRGVGRSGRLGPRDRRRGTGFAGGYRCRARRRLPTRRRARCCSRRRAGGRGPVAGPLPAGRVRGRSSAARAAAVGGRRAGAVVRAGRFRTAPGGGGSRRGRAGHGVRSGRRGRERRRRHRGRSRVGSG